MTQPQIAGRTKLTIALIALIFVVVAVFLWLIGFDPSTPGVGGGGGAGDVQLSTCGWDGFAAKVQVEATNSGSATASYSVTVEFDTTGGTKVGDDTVFINDLAPGQSGIQTALASSDYGDISCTVTGVARL
jgi:hypothetical protein